MKKPLCILGLLLGLSIVPLAAQKVLELNKSRLDVGKRRFNITQVIDARYDTTRLGVARVGMVNRKQSIVLSGSLPAAFLQYFEAKLPQQPDLPDVVVRITRFGLWEDINSGGSEGARVAADYEFYLRQGDGFAFLGDRKFRYTESLGSDVTRYHDDNLRTALQAAVDFLQDSVEWKNMGALQANATIADLFQRTIPQMLKDSVGMTGAYRNYTDFRNNHPRIQARIEVEKGASVLLIEGKKGNYRKVKPDDRIWGFCDGKQLYINQFGTFYPLQKTPDNTFWFHGVDYDKKLTNAGIGAGAFGAIGGIIAANLTKSGNYELDWETGSFLQKE